MTFAFIEEHRGQFSLTRMCQVLGVSTSGFLAWAQRTPCAGKYEDRKIAPVLRCGAMRCALCGRVLAPGMIFHSDGGSQYTSKKFRAMLSPLGIRQCQGVSCYDNAISETFFHTLKTESLFVRAFLTRAEAHQAVFQNITTFYNTRRRHSSREQITHTVRTRSESH